MIITQDGKIVFVEHIQVIALITVDPEKDTPDTIYAHLNKTDGIILYQVDRTPGYEDDLRDEDHLRDTMIYIITTLRKEGYCDLAIYHQKWLKMTGKKSSQ